VSESQQRGKHNTDNAVAEFEVGGIIGRGTGFTIKQVKEGLKRFFAKRKMPSHQWRTLEQKQALLKSNCVTATSAKATSAKATVGKPPEKPINFQSTRQHPPPGGGIKLKKFGGDVWKRL
jgi:hypothetical protein